MSLGPKRETEMRLDAKALKRVSKFLSLVLRHKPETIGIELDESGWVNVDTLLTALSLHNKNVTLQTLQKVVRTNDKKRFTFSEDGLKIRANQGHSLEVDLNLEPTNPPTELYHGTVGKFLDAIENQGLLKMGRNHVHLSEDLDTATKVGQRRGKPVMLIVDSRKMQEDGYTFYLSKNGVWLTDHVPPKYIAFKETDNE